MCGAIFYGNSLNALIRQDISRPIRVYILYFKFLYVEVLHLYVYLNGYHLSVSRRI